MDEEDLYDEFGNYIGPAVPDDEDEEDGDDDDDDELEAAFAGRYLLFFLTIMLTVSNLES